MDFHRTYGDWLKAITDAGLQLTDIMEPEPLPRENSYSDSFPLKEISVVPGTVIWRAKKP